MNSLVAWREKVMYSVRSSHILNHFHNLLYGERFPFGSLVRFEFQDKAGFQSFGFIEVLLKSREVLAVVEGDRGTFFLGGCFHADTFEYTVVVYDKFVVGSEPDIELGAVAMDGVSFH